MAELKYIIDNSIINNVVEDWIYLYPNKETIPDPKWIDPKDGSEAPQVLKYTDAQWVKEHIRRWIVQQIKRSRQKQANDLANAVGSTDGEVTNG